MNLIQYENRLRNISEKLNLFFFIIIGTALFFRCTSKKDTTIDWDYLIEKYSSKKQDSLFLSSIIFLKENIDDITSERLNFYNAKGEVIPLGLDTIRNDTFLVEHLKKYGLTYRSKILKDKDFLTTEFIEKNIKMAIDSWHKYPWNKNVSKKQFLEMVLPYKVSLEYPEEWRKYFNSGDYRKNFQTLLDSGYTDPNDIYYAGYLPSIGWLKYDLSALRLSRMPSLSEILCTKKMDCFSGSQIGVYILRSWGIPATIDIVPLWGSKNGTHATEVFLGKHGMLQTASGRELKRAAKVFRYSFKKAGTLKDPSTQKQLSFILPFLIDEHLLDVTSEHTNVTDVIYPIKNYKDQKVAYIMVYNYGKWAPVFYGNIENTRSVTFKNMGTHMLYRVGILNKNSFDTLPGLIQIDSIGKRIAYSPSQETKINLVVKKYNSGYEAFIKKGEYYSLDVLSIQGEWQRISHKLANRDSVIQFENIYNNGIYRVVNNSLGRQLERPFTYENGQQHWW